MACTVLTTPEVRAKWLRCMWEMAVKYRDPWLASALLDSFPESADIPEVKGWVADLLASPVPKGGKK